MLAWRLVSGYKNAFSMLHEHHLLIFQNHAHIQNLERSPSDCLRTEKLPKVRNRHWFLVSVNRSFYGPNVIWRRYRRHCRCCPYASVCECMPTLLQKMYQYSGQFVFHTVTLFQEIAVRWNVYKFARKLVKCWFLYFLTMTPMSVMKQFWAKGKAHV